MLRLKGWRFAFLLAVPMVLVTVGVFLMVLDLTERVSTGANTADHERAKQVVQAAFKANERQIAAVAMDNALWNDAVRAVYGPVQEDWIYDTWGVTTEAGMVYDAIFVVDQSREQVLSGYKGGKPFRPQIAGYFDSRFAKLLDRLPSDFSSHDAQAALMTTADGLAIVAASPVMSPDDSVAISAKRPVFFVLVRMLTPEFVASIGRNYLVEDLRIANGAPEVHALLRDAAGHEIAALTWRDSKPGDAALLNIRTKVLLSLASLVFVMFLIGFLCWSLLNNIARSEAAARREALTDPLTGLPNRAGHGQELDRLNAMASGRIAIAYADLDGFKHVNDQYDHHVGDALIKQVARIMSGLIGPRACLSRIGGDEFVAIFDGPHAGSDAATFAERLIIALRQPIMLEKVFAAVGASIGLVVEQAGKLPAAELMRRADIAMYEAKARGRNRICSYSTAIDAERHNDGKVVAELRRYISERRIRPMFQPIVDAASHRIVAVEALARWPEDAEIPCGPDKFISLAERNGMIDELGDVMLAEACRMAARWPETRLCINISPAQLRNPGFVSRSLVIIERAGLDCSRIEFEVTEGILLDNLDRTRVQFQQLQSAGISIALDDFGAGYSSIGYLKSISFDRIKIDRSIVSHFIHGTRQQSIVHGTILMASGMSAKVTAEGVESAEEAALLRLAGCQELQGFYFHEPMKAEDLDALLGAGEDYSAASRGRLSSAALSAASS